MIFYGLQKTTLLDYPQHLAATLFTGGCNFLCPYCHNSELITPSNKDNILTEEYILDFLKQRKGILQGVCISGGEPTLQPGLTSFIEKVKLLSLKIKLDTNGSHPKLLKELVDNQLIDYVAMDVKTSLEEYPIITGNETATFKVQESIDFLRQYKIPYEFRTTIVQELHHEASIRAMGEWLEGAAKLYLQTYKDNEQVLYSFHSCTSEQMEYFANILRKYIEYVSIR